MKAIIVTIFMTTAATFGLTAAQVQPDRETSFASQATPDQPAAQEGRVGPLPDLASQFPDVGTAGEPDEIRRLEIERFQHARQELLLVHGLINRGYPMSEYFISARQFLDAKLALDETIGQQIQTKRALLEVLRQQEQTIKVDLEVAAALADAGEAPIDARGTDLLLELSRLQYEIQSVNIELAVLARIQREQSTNN